MWVASGQALATQPSTGVIMQSFASSTMTASPIKLRLPCGQIRGQHVNGVHRFLGIPFAQPPLGALRFKRPQPVADWEGVRDAFSFAKGAIQLPRPAELIPNDPGYSEDCLYLNVWAPEIPGPHPVYVWIHGGANAAGRTATPVFDGESFARRGIVFVSIAYRLGVLGFVDLSNLLGDQYLGSGNNGLLDQVEALKWVKRNISAFGGDPCRVTVGGESAGAKNVVSLMSMPCAQGLFQRAICQSGGGQTFADQTRANDLAKLILTNLPGGGNQASSLLTATTEALLAAQASVITLYPAKSPFRAVVDGIVLQQTPLTAIAGGASKEIPLLLGSNKDEAAFYGPSKDGDGKITTADLANMPLVCFDPILGAYRALFPADGAEELRYKALTAESYGIPTIRLAEARASTGFPAYCYRFELPAEEGDFKGMCVHTSELPLVFGNLQMPMAAEAGPVGPTAECMSGVMHGLWCDFIAAKEPLACNERPWQPYDKSTRRTMIFAAQAYLHEDPYADERNLWDHWDPVPYNAQA